MPEIKGSKKVDEVLFKIMDMAYEKLQFKKWCERFVERHNSISKHKITLDKCMSSSLIRDMFENEAFKNNPEEAADTLEIFSEVADLVIKSKQKKKRK